MRRFKRALAVCALVMTVAAGTVGWAWGEVQTAVTGPPADVARFFAALTDGQRELLATRHPLVAGNLDGAPPELRYAANARALTAERGRELARAADRRSGWATTPPPAASPSRGRPGSNGSSAASHGGGRRGPRRRAHPRAPRPCRRRAARPRPGPGAGRCGDRHLPRLVHHLEKVPDNTDFLRPRPGTPVFVHDVFHGRRPLPFTEGAVVLRRLAERQNPCFTASRAHAPDIHARVHDIKPGGSDEAGHSGPSGGRMRTCRRGEGGGAMELPLVVGVDGSETALLAVDWAVDEAVRHGLPLRIVHASLSERYEAAALAETPGTVPEVVSEHDLAEGVVAQAADRARRRSATLEISTGVAAQDAVSALLREAGTATAVVTGARGRGPVKELLLGSVSLSLAARAPCPVVVVRGSLRNRDVANARVVLGVGGPATGPAAARFAFREAAVRGSVLEAVRVWRGPAHRAAPYPLLRGDPAHQREEEASVLLDDTLAAVDDLPEALAHPVVRRAVIEGSARQELLARSAAADLLVVGARRRHGHIGPQLGHVGHTLLHHADCPVALVPHQG
ncbi:universal stress protein [Streptomyces sp. NPDC018693]|uniref:universal stress protein n=1 Tax=unclassified Streptomyces TaxID=2593676 RepID=UPI00378BE6D3